MGDGNPTRSKDPVREDLIHAGITLLADLGAGGLVMRRVAAAAGVSTMCVYSRFGDKAGLLDAVYRAGFQRLDDEMSSANEAADPLERVMSLAFAYRRFALANPALHKLMFERSARPGEPPTAGAGFSLVVGAMEEATESGAVCAGSPESAAYILWTAVHGTVSLELAHSSENPFPGLFIDSAETGEQLIRQVMETTLRGMAPLVTRDR